MPNRRHRDELSRRDGDDGKCANACGVKLRLRLQLDVKMGHRAIAGVPEHPDRLARNHLVGCLYQQAAFLEGANIT